MHNIFGTVINNTMNTSILILAVILARLLLRKSPKFIICIMWGLVGIKLICPFSVESMFSLVPDGSSFLVQSEKSEIYNMASEIIEAPNDFKPSVNSSSKDDIITKINNEDIIMSVAMWIWIAGIILLCIYSLLSYSFLRRRVSVSQQIEKNIYVCDGISTPFIMGIIRKGIFLPSGLDEKIIECVLEHEKSHIKRFDYLWKPFGFILLTIYWFNPLCWIAYMLLCRDIEMACDEKVIQHKGNNWRAMYCQALLDCSTRQKTIAICPISFGEIGVKNRVEAVINYKKPSLWISIFSVIIGIVIIVCFMTTPELNNGVAKVNVIFEMGVNMSDEEANEYLKALENDLKDSPEEVVGSVAASDVFDQNNPNRMIVPAAYTDIPVGDNNITTDKNGKITVDNTQINEIKNICKKYGLDFTEKDNDIIVSKEVTFEEYISGTCSFVE